MAEFFVLITRDAAMNKTKLSCQLTVFYIFSYVFLFLLITKYFFLPSTYVISRSKSVTNINLGVTNEKTLTTQNNKRLINKENNRRL